MSYFQIETETSAPSPDKKSKSPLIQARRIPTSASGVDLPPPHHFVRRSRSIYAAPKGPTPAKESVVFGAESTDAYLHGSSSNSNVCETNSVDKISKYDDLLMALMELEIDWIDQ